MREMKKLNSLKERESFKNRQKIKKLKLSDLENAKQTNEMRKGSYNLCFASYPASGKSVLTQKYMNALIAEADHKIINRDSNPEEAAKTQKREIDLRGITKCLRRG